MRLSNDTTIRYFAWLDEDAAGPYTLEGLESLVYLGKITPDTLVCPEGQEQWEPIRRNQLHYLVTWSTRGRKPVLKDRHLEAAHILGLLALAHLVHELVGAL